MVNLSKLKKITNDLNGFAQDFAKEMEYEAFYLKTRKKTPIFNFLKNIFENVKSSVTIVSKDCKILYANPIAKTYAKKFGGSSKIGDYCIKFWSGKNDKCTIKCPMKKAMKSKKMFISKFKWAKQNYEIVSIPLSSNGVTSVLVIANKR